MRPKDRERFSRETPILHFIVQENLGGQGQGFSEAETYEPDDKDEWRSLFARRAAWILDSLTDGEVMIARDGTLDFLSDIDRYHEGLGQEPSVGRFGSLSDEVIDDLRKLSAIAEVSPDAARKLALLKQAQVIRKLMSRGVDR